MEDEKMEVEKALDQIHNDDKNLKKPFDMIFVQYIFMSSTNKEIRTKALEVLIKNFNQRDHMVRELSRSEIIVSE